jgi:hypothetical protein
MIVTPAFDVVPGAITLFPLCFCDAPAGRNATNSREAHFVPAPITALATLDRPFAGDPCARQKANTTSREQFARFEIIEI